MRFLLNVVYGRVWGKFCVESWLVETVEPSYHRVSSSTQEDRLNCRLENHALVGWGENQIYMQKEWVQLNDFILIWDISLMI